MSSEKVSYNEKFHVLCGKQRHTFLAIDCSELQQCRYCESTRYLTDRSRKQAHLSRVFKMAQSNYTIVCLCNPILRLKARSPSRLCTEYQEGLTFNYAPWFPFRQLASLDSCSCHRPRRWQGGHPIFGQMRHTQPYRASIWTRVNLVI